MSIKSLPVALLNWDVFALLTLLSPTSISSGPESAAILFYLSFSWVLLFLQQIIAIATEAITSIPTTTIRAISVPPSPESSYLTSTFSTSSVTTSSTGSGRLFHYATEPVGSAKSHSVSSMIRPIESREVVDPIPFIPTNWYCSVNENVFSRSPVYWDPDFNSRSLEVFTDISFKPPDDV